MSKQCYYSEFGDRKHFVCSLDQECCGTECCDKDYMFYHHWYFWISVVILFMFVIAAGISGYCKHRKPPLSQGNGLGNQINEDADSQTTLIPWAVALDEDPSAA